jgi:hypothetical protein
MQQFQPYLQSNVNPNLGLFGPNPYDLSSILQSGSSEKAISPTQIQANPTSTLPPVTLSPAHEDSDDEHKLVIDESTKVGETPENKVETEPSAFTNNPLIARYFASQQAGTGVVFSQQDLIQQILGGKKGGPQLIDNTVEASNSAQSTPTTGRKRKSDEEGRFECHICKKKFSRQWYVNGAHMRMHSKFFYKRLF